MNKYYRHLQTAVYFFWKLIGFSWEQIYEQVLQTLINCRPFLPAYPLVAPPSRVVWTEETDKRLMAVKGAIHDFVSSSCTSGIKGQNAVIQPWGFRTGRSVDLQPDTHGWPGKHGRQLWVRCGGGDNTRAGQPHRTFILRGREPIPRCCDQHLILGWRTEWNAGRPMGWTSEITREPDGTFAAWGVRGPCDVPSGEALTVILRSPRARETSAGGGKGCQSFQKGKARSQRSHAHTPTTGA